MNKRIFKIEFLLSFFFCLIIFVYSAVSSDVTAPEKGTEPLSIMISRKFLATDNRYFIKKIACFSVETASEVKSRNKGLSGRSHLPEGHGMLFILDKSEENIFWMKGMNFPIDILFFDMDKRVIEIHKNLLPCSNCSLIRPDKPVSYALEINSGDVDKYDIKAGDLFEFGED